MRLLLLSSTSGFLSYLSISLPHWLSPWFKVSDDSLFVLPGVLFGLFILVPLVESKEHRLLRRIGLLLFSIFAWYVAVSMGFQALPLIRQTPILSCGISGVIGVLLLALTSRYLVPVKLAQSSILIAALLGFLGGAIIGSAFKLPRASLASEVLYLLGFLFWHCSVAHALFAEGRPFTRFGKPASVGQAPSAG
ncbi:MAG: hypothetical protein QNJ22_15130 [Desulfosarcinaceae bacterium]|nr:hypothetical protein [Desulfosarcinaceae bacterium]